MKEPPAKAIIPQKLPAKLQARFQKAMPSMKVAISIYFRFTTNAGVCHLRN